MEYHKPSIIARKLEQDKQKAFIESYEKLLNSLGDHQAVLFADAVIQPMPRGPPAAGRQNKRSLRLSKRAAASVSIFTARLTLRPGRPG